MKLLLLSAGCMLVAALILVLARSGGHTAPGVEASTLEAREDARPDDALLRPDTPDSPPMGSAPIAGGGETTQSTVPASTDLALPSDDPVRCVVYGRVIDASGGSLADRELYVGLEDASGTRVRATTTARGCYSATGLAPGRWLVEGFVRGYHQSRVPIQLGSERVVRHDIELEPAVILRVKLTAPDGTPFFEALRRLDPAGVGNLVPVATVDPPGATFDGVIGSLNNSFGAGTFWQSGYVFERLPPGYYGVIVLDGEPPVHVSMVLLTAVLATQRVEPGAEEVAFVLDPQAVLAMRSALRCRVVDGGTGAPFAGAEVALISPGGGMREPSPVTGAGGEVLLQGYDPGAYELWVRADGRADVRRQVVLPPGQTLEVDAIAMEPETWIAGRLIDGAGSGVETTLELGLLDPRGQVALVKNQRWRSDQRGAFRIPALAPGRYVVRTLAREGRPGFPEQTRASANLLVSTLGGPVENLELVQLPIGRLVLQYDRDDWKTLRYSAVDAQGLEREASRLWSEKQQSIPLPCGDYTLRVTDAKGEVLLERAIAIGAEPLAIQLPED